MCNLILKKVTDVNGFSGSYKDLCGFTIGKITDSWLGLDGVSYYTQGGWNDPLIGYNGVAFSANYIIDPLYENYVEECKEAGVADNDDDFDRWLVDNNDMALEYIEEFLYCYHEEVCATLRKSNKPRRKSKKVYTYDVIEQAKNFAREHGGRVDKYEGPTTTYVFTTPGYKTQVYIYYGMEQGQQVYTCKTYNETPKKYA